MSSYNRSVFGARTALSAIDPASLVLDMGPYSGTRIDPHAFASGHQYGAAVGMRGLGQQFIMQRRGSLGCLGCGTSIRGLGAELPPVYDPSGAPVPQVTQTFAYDPSGAPVPQVATINSTVTVPTTTGSNIVPTVPTLVPVVQTAPVVVTTTMLAPATSAALKYGLLGLFAGVAGVFLGRYVRRKVR